MEPLVAGEPAGLKLEERYYSVVSAENYRVLVPQDKLGRIGVSTGNDTARHCTTVDQPCRHMFHIPTSQRSAATLPANIGDIAAALNYRVHIIQGTLEHCNLIYHTLTGHLKKSSVTKNPDLERKLGNLEKTIQALRSSAQQIKLSQKDIDQISSKLGIVVSGRIQVPTAEEISSQIKVPSALDISKEIGEISLNEVTKSDLVDRISKHIPVSAIAKDLAGKIVIPPIRVPSASEIAALIKIPTAQELASQLKYPSAQEIANLIQIPKAEVSIDYRRIAEEVSSKIKIPSPQSINQSSLAAEIASLIKLPESKQVAIDYDRIASEVSAKIQIPPARNIDTSSLASQIVSQIPRSPDSQAIAEAIIRKLPPTPAFPTEQQIASAVKLQIPTAQEIANNIINSHPEIVPSKSSAPAKDYTPGFDNIDKKLNEILAFSQGFIN